MKKIIITLIFSVLIGIFFSTAYAAERNLSSHELKEIIAQVYEAPAKKFLLKNTEPPKLVAMELCDPKDCDLSNYRSGFRIVFVCENKRYTVDHNWWIHGIQFWVRPNGTSDPRLAVGADDRDLDGVVEFGTDGNVRIFDEKSQEGLKWKPYWQEKYNEMLRCLKETLSKK